MTQEDAHLCARCGATYAPALLLCPACGGLTHSDSLKRLLAESAEAEAAQDWSGALAPLREAQVLLPPESRQWRVVSDKLRALSAKAGQGPALRPAARPRVSGDKRLQRAGTGALGVGAFLLKFKAVLFALLAKGKLLALAFQGGLPLLSLVGSYGVYWTVFGWKLAAGFMAALYLHELGHVSALKRYGFKASAPMFIPGLGAFVRLHQRPVSVVEDARIGLAGPAAGLAATLAMAGAWAVTGHPLLAVTLHLSAMINLFNLLPILPLDGGRALSSLDESERVIVALLAGGLAFAFSSLLLGALALLILLLAGSGHTPLEGDRRGAFELGAVITLLALLAFKIPVPPI